jgi:hypothetical protein
MINQFSVAGPNSKYKQAGAEPAGFWAGFWHGSIAPIALLVSLFKPGVGIYETNNNGPWYDFGFILGLSGSLSQRSVKIQVGDQKQVGDGTG